MNTLLAVVGGGAARFTGGKRGKNGPRARLFGSGAELAAHTTVKVTPRRRSFPPGAALTSRAVVTVPRRVVPVCGVA